jgi:N-hydroxyarylamine O-acetyltransferase
MAITALPPTDTIPALTRDLLLSRIGLEQAPVADSVGLREIHRAFLTHVPYEAITVQLGESQPLHPPALVDRVLNGGRGGYCFEVNSVFKVLLEAVGFTVERRVGYVGDRDRRATGGPANHMVLVVDTPDDGRYIADAGLGEGPIDPLPLRPGRIVAAPFEWTVEREPNGWWVGQHEWGNFAGFSFGDEPAELADFEPHHQRLSTSAESDFVQKLILQKPTNDRIVTLRARTYFEDGPDVKVRRVLGSIDEFADVLHISFGVDPDALGEERLGRLWSLAQLHHQPRS